MKHEKSPVCGGKQCSMCGDDASHKVGEISWSSRCPWSAYVCCRCFVTIMGPAVAVWCGVGPRALAGIRARQRAAGDRSANLAAAAAVGAPPFVRPSPPKPSSSPPTAWGAIEFGPVAEPEFQQGAGEVLFRVEFERRLAVDFPSARES
jgi:hypothetical protein